MNDIYSEPAQYGLQIVWDSGGGGGYDWDVVVWGSTLTGAVWAGQDNGCSCNSPFDQIRGLTDINELPRIDPNRGHDAARATVLDLLNAGYEWNEAERQAMATEAADAILTWAHDHEHTHDDPTPVRRGL